MKPFSPRELLARVDALLRRAEIGPQPPSVIRLGNVELSPTRHDVVIDGRHRRADQGRVWIACSDAGATRLGSDPQPARSIGCTPATGSPALERTVDVHVFRLREKLRAAHANAVIVTIRGVGYKLTAEERVKTMAAMPGRASGASCAARWSALGLRWQLVVLNVVCHRGDSGPDHRVDAQHCAAAIHGHHACRRPAGRPGRGSAGLRCGCRGADLPDDCSGCDHRGGTQLRSSDLCTSTADRGARGHAAHGAWRSPIPVATNRRDEIGGVADSVNELAELLQRLEELRRQVTNDAAHELRTPLHNLLGLIEGMRDGVIPATPARLQQAHNELGRLIALVEDLRGLADAQVARDRMAHEPLHLEKLVRDVVLGFETSLQTHGLTCQIVAPQGEPTVEGDAGRLGQVIGNIFDNAVRSAAAGSVITIKLVRHDWLVRVAVHDVGEAIEADLLPHIFERFYRADPSCARGSGGAGIGLAIVKELVAAHGGIVGAESGSDGVTVWFELPLQSYEPDPSPPSDAAQPIRTLDAASSA